jgi:isopentenyl-diphosphate delta-isomerase type 1
VVEHVVVVDGSGTPVATVPKAEAHSRSTPLHLAFSCHVVRADGSVLLARRSARKATWPGAWSNACCGHPQLGETLRAAVTRRLQQELGARPTRLALAVPDFAYRARMDDGTVEHELCPVVVAEIDGALRPDPAEVEDVKWVSWSEVRAPSGAGAISLTPWALEQVAELARLGESPASWLQVGHDGLDRCAGAPAAAGPPTHRAADPSAPVRRSVDALLDRFLAAKRDELTAIDPVLDDLGAEIAELVAVGGKRLRPAFLYWGHRSTGAPHDDAALHLGAAIELLHTFALLHDDVMDRSSRRRGRRAAHVGLAAQHRAAGLEGDPGWFGTSGAILAGDLAHVWAGALLDAAPLDPAAGARAREAFTRLRDEVMAGQYLDLVVAASPDADERSARRVALLKSARYSVTRPLLLGAAIGGEVSPALDGSLRAYGDAVGLAFQLRDDVLGLFGDSTATGKGSLDDLREGKRTLLVLRGRRLADERGRRLIDGALGDPSLDEDRAEAVRAVIAASGALASVERLIDAEHAAALRAVVGLPEPARDALVRLAASAIRRDR